MVVERPARVTRAADARRGTRSVAVFGALVLVASVAATIALVAARLDGIDTFVTHPVSCIALAGAAAGIAALSGRREALGDHNGARWMLGLAAAVAGYLVLGAIATTTPSAAVIGLWSAWWAVPLVVVQLAALSAARTPGWWSIAFGGLASVAIALGAAFTRPTEPFAGLAPIAPESWPVSPVLDSLTIALALVTLAVPTVLLVRALRRERGERLGSVLIAAAAAVPPLLIAVCYGLAVARDPGAVEPALGSVGYLVALSTGCLVAALALTLVRPSADPAVARRLISVVLGAYAAALVALAATMLGSWLAPGGPLVSGLAIAALTVAVTAAWWRIVTTQLASLGEHDRIPPAGRLSLLSPREREVLALLAEGARDADIAARLHLSERTIESHLTRIFAKLGLDSAEGRNRRVLAVRAWAESVD